MVSANRDFGVLYGQKTTEDALLIYSSYSDSKASPQTGDFIVLTPRDEDGQKYLARVEAEVYDEDPIFRSQDKTLVAVHYARIAERDLSDRDKQKMFSYTYKVKMLGKFTENGSDFNTAVRKLPLVSYHARHLTPREFEHIINGSNQNGKKIGHLCIGDDIQQEEREVLFDVDKLKSKRTMVFAQSGFGKTNLVKGLLTTATKDTTVGKLVFDLEGEYCFRSQRNYGLSDIDSDVYRDNVVIFSDKMVDTRYKDKMKIAGAVKIDLSKDFSVDDILQAAIGLTGAGKTFLVYLSSLSNQDAVQTFIGKIVNGEDPIDLRRYAYQNFSSYFQDNKTSKSKKTKNAQAEDSEPEDIESTVSQASKSMLGAVVKQIRSFSNIHQSNSSLVSICLSSLGKGKTVILDMSLKDNSESSIIASTLVKRLFENNKAAHTSLEVPIKTIIFVEEAQNVLSDEFVRSNANPFVKVAKQGRKFDIGLVAITQRPSSISEEIRSQAENYFVMHMSNSKDIKALIESNINYSGVIAKFIQLESIPGNLYMVSVNQTFAVPLRVREFDKEIHPHVYEKSKFSREERPDFYPESNSKP